MELIPSTRNRPYALVNCRPPSLTWSKVLWERGLRVGTAGSPQPGPTRPQPQRRAHVSRSTFAPRLWAGSGDSEPSTGFRRKAARGAHPGVEERGPACPRRRVPPVRPPAPSAGLCGGVAWHTLAAGDGGAYLSAAAEELPCQSV